MGLGVSDQDAPSAAVSRARLRFRAFLGTLEPRNAPGGSQAARGAVR